MSDDQKTFIPGLERAEFGIVAPARQSLVATVSDTDGGAVHFNLVGRSIERFVNSVLVATSQLDAAPPGDDGELEVSQMIPANSCGLVANDSMIGITVRVGPVDLVFPLTKAALTELAKEILDDDGIVAFEPPAPTRN